MESLYLCALLSVSFSTQTIAESTAVTDSDRLLGTWQGTRWSASDGAEEDLTIEVDPILGSAGLSMEMIVTFDSGKHYRGHWVQILDREKKNWNVRYANGVRRTWAMLEGDGRQFLNVAPQRTRESKLESELLADGRWRRTQSISEDGTEWTTLFVDTLERTDDSAPSVQGDADRDRRLIEELFTVDFVRSWQQADAAALAGLWVDDGDWMSVVGSRRIVTGADRLTGVWSVGLQGRESAEQLALEIEVDAVQMLTSTLAQVDLVMSFGSETTGLMREAMVAIVTNTELGWRIASSRVARIPDRR